KNRFLKSVFAKNITLFGESTYLRLGEGAYINGSINGKDENKGYIEFQGGNFIKGEIGESMSIHTLSVAGEKVEVSGGVKAKEIQFNSPKSTLTIGGQTKASIVFNQSSTLNINNDLAGSSDFRGTDSIIIVGDGASINADLDNSEKECNGRVELQGSAKLTGKIGATNSIQELRASGAGEIYVEQPINSCNITIGNEKTNMNIDGELKAEKVLFEAAGVLNMNNNMSATTDFQGNDGRLILAEGYSISGNVDNSGREAAGTLEMRGSGGVEGNIGETNALKAVIGSGAGDIKLAGKVLRANNVIVSDDKARITIDGELSAKELRFDANGEIIVNNNDLKGTNIVSADGVDKGILTVNTDQNLTGTISGFGTINMNGDILVDLNPINTDLSNVNITSSQDSQGSVNLAKTGLIIGSIGSELAKLKEVNFVKGGTVGDIYADSINIANGSRAMFEGDVIVNKAIIFNGSAAQAVFNGGDIKAEFVANGGGKLSFNKANITSDIGSSDAPFTEINFIETGSASDISGNLYADRINVRNNNMLNLKKDVLFEGVVNISDSTLNIGVNDLIFENGVANISSSTVCIDANAGDSGQLIASDGSELSLTGNIQLDIKKFDTMPTEATELQLVSKKGTGVLNSGSAIIEVTNAGNSFVKWDVEQSSDGIKLVSENIMQEVLEEEVGDSVSQEVIDGLFNFTEGTQGERFVRSLSKMSTESRQKVIKKVVSNNQKKTAPFRQTIIKDRFHEKLVDRVRVVDGTDSYSAPAAGEINGKHGVWASPFVSKINQSAEKGVSGHTTNSYGVIVGADRMFSESLTVGLSAAYIGSNTKYKDEDSKDDKSRVKSSILSMYSNFEFKEKWFLHNIFSLGLSRVKDSELTVNDDATLGTKKSDYDSKLFAIEARVGKNYSLENYNLMITPELGLAYTSTHDDAYTETGDDVDANQLTKVSKNTHEKLDVIAGVRFTSKAMEYKGFEWKPELIATMRYDLLDNEHVVDRTIPGLDLPVDTQHQSERLYGTIILGMSASKDCIEYGVQLGNSFAKKFYNITGSLNIRVNF
ncbi:MAG: hypothetical protein DGJ47_001077, partial [Rickettsiaceae bacterium]